MEITSFILGMLTIIGMAAAVVIVLGLVKIYKQSKKVEQLENVMDKEIGQLYHNINESKRELNQKIEHVAEHVFKLIEEEKKDIISYTDSRIDKLQSKKEATK